MPLVPRHPESSTRVRVPPEGVGGVLSCSCSCSCSWIGHGIPTASVLPSWTSSTMASGKASQISAGKAALKPSDFASRYLRQRVMSRAFSVHSGIQSNAFSHALVTAWGPFGSL